jgi:hypothetical protein
VREAVRIVDALDRARRYFRSHEPPLHFAVISRATAIAVALQEEEREAVDCQVAQGTTLSLPPGDVAVVLALNCALSIG